jgi:exopolysaccharide biosynthesis polyprenyl glycosylphosphotransferase
LARPAPTDAVDAVVQKPGRRFAPSGNWSQPPEHLVVSQRHRPRDSAVRRLLLAGDSIGLATGLLGATLIFGLRPGHVLWGLASLPLWIVIFKAYGLYDRDIRRINHSSVDDVPWLLHAMLLGCLLWWIYFRLLPLHKLEFDELLTFALIGSAVILALRTLSRRLARRWLGPERVLLVGEGESLALLARKLRAHPEYGAEPVGFVSTSEALPSTPVPVLGDLKDLDLPDTAARHGVERVVVARGDVPKVALLDLIRRCRIVQVKVSVLPQLFDAMGSSVEIDDVEGITLLGLNPPVLSRSSQLLKRAMDLLGAFGMLVLTLPVIVICAVAIKLNSEGPVFFCQERVGRGGRRFKVIKFRTMVIGADRLQEELRAQSRDPHWLLIDDDPRITRVGRLLRHTSLDELPQLINVLKGEMSLVGPRPMIESEDRQLDGWRRSRLDLTPGLTGLWQVLGRTSIPFEEMVKLDYLYVTNWSLWTDVRLILQTLPVVVTRRGVN